MGRELGGTCEGTFDKALGFDMGCSEGMAMPAMIRIENAM